MRPLLEWLTASALAQALTAHPTLYLFLNAAHILAIGLLAGAIVPLDLRLLGLFRPAPLSVLGPFLSRAAMAGLILAMLTGAMLFSTKAIEYAGNPAFIAKMLLLLTGALNALLLHANPRWQEALLSGQAALSVRLAAALSLCTWVAAIVAGRWIGFV